MIYYIIIDISIKILNGINSKIKTIEKKRTCVQMFHMKHFIL